MTRALPEPKTPFMNMTTASSSSSTGSSFSPKPSTPQLNYHVFLSFRGETRTNFTAHLYAALKREGIVTFKDDNELERGDVMSEKLLKAIEESLFAVVVLSENYAESSWCLEELQKILESRQDLDQTVFPIFHGVDPSDVRYQKKTFATAFKKHEGRFKDDKVQKWREALTKVAEICGWDTKHKDEAGIIEDIIAAVWTKLRKLPRNVEHLVGIKSKVDEMISILKVGLDETCFIAAIWGMGGIGKTTLARVVYDAIQSKFEASCFLANVRKDSESNSLLHLQKKLLSGLLRSNVEISDSYEVVERIRSFSCNKQVLIVLDEVNHIDQLESLAGNKDWFGNGSRIIVTTRDIHLLRAHGDDQFVEYKIQMLDECESLKLLCEKAFKKDEAEEGYLELSKQVVRHVGGLPLALQVLGSFLCKRSQIEWRDTVDTLKHSFHHEDILKTLRISYDGLENEEYKKLFLDIACFFNGKSISEATRIWENCGLRSIAIGINVLVEKSLLHLTNDVDILHMHDLLQEMGKKIVLEESRNSARRCSRLWSQPQIDPLLTRNMGTEKIQSIVLRLEQQCNVKWHPDCFSKMCNLRLLYLRNVHLSCSLNSLPNALRVLIWEKCSLKALPQNIDQLYELVELQLCQSNIRHLWNRKLILGNLKFINLSCSEVLIETPDFSGVLNLENLFLDGCISLVKVHESLGQLKKLIKLSLSGCKSLVTFPRKLETDSLEELILSGCNKLEELPEFGENMNRLSIFDTLGCCNIRQVPSSVVHLTNLKELSFPKCKGQSGNLGRSFSMFRRISNPMGLKLPNSFTGLSSLTKLDLSCCNLRDGSIPNDLNGLSSLMILDLSENNFASLPIGCISNLVNLERFDLNGCARLHSIPHLPPNLLAVDATGCPSMKPLIDIDVKHLFASLLSKRRDVLSHEVILMLISGHTIPLTWFNEQECYVDPLGEIVSIVVDTHSTPYGNYDDNTEEWSGIAICLKVKPRNLQHFHIGHTLFWWSFEGSGGNRLSSQKVDFLIENKTKNAHSEPQLVIAFFPFNTQNCGQHISRQLQLQIEVGEWCDIKECGWCLICKQDFETYNYNPTSGATFDVQAQRRWIQIFSAETVVGVLTMVAMVVAFLGRDEKTRERSSRRRRVVSREYLKTLIRDSKLLESYKAGLESGQ